MIALRTLVLGNKGCNSARASLEDLSLLPDNFHFLKWRPKFHFQAPNSWMNGRANSLDKTHWQIRISATTILLLISGSWDTNIITDTSIGVVISAILLNLENISIAGAFSNDLVYWIDSGAGWENPTVIGRGPPGSYDHLGIFSGSAIENGYMGYPTAFYTSVKRLPISWAIPYLPGSETQSFSYTKDNGKTWIKYERNPVISDPPPGIDVTGWRDVLVFRDDNLASILKDPANTVYMTLSSGERPRSGGRILLYRASDTNLTSWDYLGILFSAPGNSIYSPFSGNYGFNFEMAGYQSIPSEHGLLHVVTFGSEGGRVLQDGKSSHGNHWPLFAAGSVTPEGVLKVSMSGVLDWGEAYAHLGFEDPLHKRRLIWGWTYEDDNGY
jgi:beta-fructofuranosidase